MPFFDHFPPAVKMPHLAFFDHSKTHYENLIIYFKCFIYNLTRSRIKDSS